MELKKLPIGIDNFEKLRREGFYFIDKTLLIRDLLNGWSEVNLFTRPRRFGKTLNMSMLKSFFEIGGDPSLFDGLAIAGEPQLCEAHQGQYPVVSVSLKGVDGLTFDAARARMAYVVREEAVRLQFLLQSVRLSPFDKKPLESMLVNRAETAQLEESLRILSQLLEKHYGRKVILLIDEYDVPLDKAYQHGYYDEMISLIRGMFGAALKTNDSLQFAVLTGCLRVSKESIFTGLNNLKVHSISDTQFDEYFGFTESEVEQLLREYNLSPHASEMKEWYDGYRFGEQDVYCPWDVINYCYDLRASASAQPKAYWLNTSGNDMVRRLIDKAKTATAMSEIERLASGEALPKTLNDHLTHNEIDQSIDNVWSLLYTTGYLTTVRQPARDRYELIIPNKELRQIYIDQIRQWFAEQASADADKLTALYAAFESGDVETIKTLLDRELLNTISFHDAHESFYHGFLLALLNTCADWQVTSNTETGKGRSDILVERKDRTLGFVVEVKDVKDVSKLPTACDIALRQIQDKDYTATLRRYRVPTIRTYGIAFHDKECQIKAGKASPQ